MIRNDIDDFRQQFFQKVIDDEQQKQKKEKQLQEKCFHLFNILGPITPNGYQERMCTKCGFFAIKRIQVWEGTKRCSIQ